MNFSASTNAAALSDYEIHTISEATYEKLLRAGELTHQEPEVWADLILFRMASATVRIFEKSAGGAPDDPERME